jgi:hypothetical protein
MGTQQDVYNMTDNLELEPTPTLEGPIQTTGTIDSIELRQVSVPGQDEQVTYADFHVKVEHKELSEILGGSALKVGYPARVNGDTKLGALLRRFGVDISKKVDLNVLQGRRVNVNCYKAEGNDGGMFWRIERDTVLPAGN